MPSKEPITVEVPGEPELTPEAALVLLKILKEASDRRSAQDGEAGERPSRNAADLP